MNQVNLKVKLRETGKQESKKYRAEGFVPGVYYTKGGEPLNLLADPKSLKPIVFTAERKVVNLEIEGMEGVKECVLKDVQFDPVTDKIKHFDLYGFIQGQRMTVDVPVVIKGTAIGVREGGVMQHLVHKVTVHCFPKNMPTSIEIDVTNMKIGESVLVRNIHMEGVEFMMPSDTSFVSIMAPRVSAEKGQEKAAE